MMNKKRVFYLIIILAVVADGFLIAHPNLLGKIGLFIYKYHYLRTFPRALLTVSIVVAVAMMISEGIHFGVRKNGMKRRTGFVTLLIALLFCMALLAKVHIDFSSWTYSHTGLKFKYGAYLLPMILIAIFLFALFTLPKVTPAWPVSPSSEDKEKL